MSTFNGMKHFVRGALEFLADDYEDVGIVAAGAATNITHQGEAFARVTVSSSGKHRLEVSVTSPTLGAYSGEYVVHYRRKFYPLYPTDGHQRLLEEVAVEIRHLLEPLLDTTAPF